MAEVAGLVIAGAGLLSLVDTVKRGFAKIDTARNLGDAYEEYSMQLDLARLAFHRWLAAVYITDTVNSSTNSADLPVASDQETKVVERLLGNIKRAFEDAERTAQRYEIGEQPIPTPAVDGRNPDLGVLSSNIRETTKKRQSSVKLLDKVRWVVKDSKAIQNLVTKVSENVKSLVEAFPSATGEIQKKLAVQQLHDIAPANTERSKAQLLKSLAATTDPILEDGTRQAIAGGHYVNNVKALGNSRALYGDQYGEGGKDPGTRHSFNNAVVGDHARAQYGNNVNMPNFWA